MLALTPWVVFSRQAEHSCVAMMFLLFVFFPRKIMAVRNKLRYYMLFLNSIARSNLTKWPVKLLGAYRPDKNSAIAKNGNGNPTKRRNFDLDVSDLNMLLTGRDHSNIGSPCSRNLNRQFSLIYFYCWDSGVKLYRACQLFYSNFWGDCHFWVESCRNKQIKGLWLYC